MDFISSLEHFSLPTNLEQVSIDENTYIPYKTYVELVEADDDAVKNLVPVIDGVKWIAKAPRGGYYSSDGVKVVHTPGNKSTITLMEKGERGLVPYEIITPKPNNEEVMKRFEQLKSESEVNTMADNLMKGLEGLEAMARKAEDTKESVTPMDVNSGAAKEAVANKNVGKKDGGIAPLQSTVNWDDNEQAMIDFNQEYGRLHCVITRSDHKPGYGTSAIKTKGNKSGSGLDSRNHGQVNKDALRGSEGLKQLTFKDTKPSPFVGACISMPVGGCFTRKQLKKKEMVNEEGKAVPLRVDTSRKDLLYVILEKDEFINRVLYSFGFSIDEDETIYGADAGTIDVRLVSREDKDGNTVSKPRLKAPKGRSVVAEKGYFPLQTFKLVKYESGMSKEDLNRLNFSAFYHLFKEKAGKSPYSALQSDYQRKVSRVSHGETMEIDGHNVPLITSTIYPADGERSAIDCKIWYKGTNQPNNTYDDAAIPYKSAVLTGDNTIPTAKVKTIHCVKDVAQPEYAELCSLNDERFSHIVNDERFGHLFTVEELGKVFKPRRSTKAISDEIAARNKTFALLPQWEQENSLGVEDSLARLINLNK